MTAIEFLVSKGILQSADLETRFNLNMSRDGHVMTIKKIVEAMEEYRSLDANHKIFKEAIMSMIYEESSSCKYCIGHKRR